MFYWHRILLFKIPINGKPLVFPSTVFGQKMTMLLNYNFDLMVTQSKDTTIVILVHLDCTNFHDNTCNSYWHISPRISNVKLMTAVQEKVRGRPRRFIYWTQYLCQIWSQPIKKLFTHLNQYHTAGGFYCVHMTLFWSYMPFRWNHTPTDVYICLVYNFIFTLQSASSKGFVQINAQRSKQPM